MNKSISLFLRSWHSHGDFTFNDISPENVNLKA